VNPSNRPFVRARRALAAAAIFLSAAVLAARGNLPPAVGSAATPEERDALASWALSQPEVRDAVGTRRTRVLRAWTDEIKVDGIPRRRGTVLLRDYDAGTSREITVDLATGWINLRELPGVQPSEDEIREAMEIARKDPALARFARDPRLTLMGGFYNVSVYPDDPCSREICLELAFMKPSYEKNPARHLIVNLTRRVVSNHDFRPARAGAPAPRMSEPEQ
jgi:hypothetical protein